MDRDRQIDMMTTAEERTTGHLQAWMKKPEFRASLVKPNPEREQLRHERRQLRKRVCG